MGKLRSEAAQTAERNGTMCHSGRCEKVVPTSSLHARGARGSPRDHQKRARIWRPKTESGKHQSEAGDDKATAELRTTSVAEAFQAEVEVEA
jgi:hypothetical protein